MILLACYAAFVTLALAGTTWFSYVCARKNLALEDQREELVDRIEESLDMLDECYQRVSRAADVPVLTDEPIIREVINDIKHTKNAILAVASLVVTYGSDDEEGT